MSSTITYDYAIIGAGAAGMHLAVAILESPDLQDKRILILEKDQKNSNDRTWSFWEKDGGNWDDVVYKSWDKGLFHDVKGTCYLDLQPYRYKTIRSSDFYQKVKNILHASDRVTWKAAVVESVNDGEPAEILADQRYRAKLVFDSRIDKAFFTSQSDTKLWQHFKGWIVEMEEDVFDPESFTMMDFRHIWKETTSFTYILPINSREALVEYTFFSPDIVEEVVYDDMLQQYFDTYLNQSSYQISETEKGVIPMSDYLFERHHGKFVYKIGTAGGWVKPSSGYSFKNAERFAKQIVQNLVKGEAITKDVISRRHRLYDQIFLDVLAHRNDLGPEIFAAMYTKLSPELIFRFLDEETTLFEDLRIISSFRSGPFLRAVQRKFFGNNVSNPVVTSEG